MFDNRSNIHIFTRKSTDRFLFLSVPVLIYTILVKPHAYDSVGDEVNYYLQYVKDTNLPNPQSRYTCHLHRTNRSFDATIGFF